MANHVSHGALPYPIKGARFTVQVPYLDADGDPTDPTTPDTERSIDGAAFADCTEEVTTITGSNGVGYITLTGDELNASIVALAAKVASGPKATLITLHPRALPILESGTAQAGAAGSITLAAGAAAYDITGCFVRTTGGTGGGGGSGAQNNQVRRVTAYNVTTKVASVTPNWETTPDATTTYDVLLPEGVTPAMVRALTPSTPGRTLAVESDGMAHADLKEWLGVAPAALDSQSVRAHLRDGAHGGTAAVITAERIVVASTTGNEPALKLTGNGTAAGLLSTGGDNGPGISAQGGALSGQGIVAQANNGNQAGINAVGAGTEAGLRCRGGATGPGIEAIGGSTSGSGMKASATAGNSHGIEAVAAGTGKDIEGQLGGLDEAVPVSPTSGSLNERVKTMDDADIPGRLPAALTAAGHMKADVLAISGATDSADRLRRSTKAIALGTVGSGSTTTTIVVSSLSPASAGGDQFNGRIIAFGEDTTTAALRCQAAEITDWNHATSTFTVTALTVAPASGDTFTIT